MPQILQGRIVHSAIGGIAPVSDRWFLTVSLSSDAIVCKNEVNAMRRQAVFVSLLLLLAVAAVGCSQYANFDSAGDAAPSPPESPAAVQPSSEPPAPPASPTGDAEPKLNRPATLPSLPS